MKAKNRLILKQSLKYFVVFLVFVIGIGLYRLMWTIPLTQFLWLLGIAVAIIIVLAIFDIASAKDVISIFKG